MTQLIIDDFVLPEAKKGTYTCKREPLKKVLQMISGRTIIEKNGEVTVITYSYGYFTQEEMRELLTIMRSGSSHTVSYLSQEQDDLITEQMHVIQYSPPQMQFSKDDGAVWLGFSFELRGVDPIA